MNREQVMTNPRDLVRVELENQGIDIDKIEIPHGFMKIKRIDNYLDGRFSEKVEAARRI